MTRPNQSAGLRIQIYSHECPWHDRTNRQVYVYTFTSVHDTTEPIGRSTCTDSQVSMARPNQSAGLRVQIHKCPWHDRTNRQVYVYRFTVTSVHDTTEPSGMSTCTDSQSQVSMTRPNQSAGLRVQIHKCPWHDRINLQVYMCRCSTDMFR